MLGEILRSFRTKKKMSLEDLAKETSLSYRTIYSIEKNITKFPRSDTLKKIANALDITVNDLIE